MTGISVSPPAQVASAPFRDEDNPAARRDTTHASGDLAGAADGAARGAAAPVLPAPTVDAAAMMYMLTTLQSKVADENMKLGEAAIENARTDIENQNKRRAAEVEKYWKEMDQSHVKQKLGFFGAIINFFKQLFTGHVAEAFKSLGDNIVTMLTDIGKLVAGVLAIVFAAAASAVSGGLATPALALAVAGFGLMVAGMVMSDPGIQDMIMKSLPPDSREAAMWSLFAVSLVLQIAGSIMQCCSNPASIPKLGQTVRDMTVAVTSVTQGAASIATGVEAKQATDHRASAGEAQARMDLVKAAIGKLEALRDRDMSDLKTVLDSYTAIIASTADMVRNYAQGMRAASSV